MGDNKEKSYVKEYVYLIISALVSYYLIQAEYGKAEDVGLNFMWNVVKMCRKAEVFFARIGDDVYRKLDDELENRRTI